MKLEKLSPNDAVALVDELRSMAELEPGPNKGALQRAKEIRFQLSGQEHTSPSAIARVDEVYRELEVLLHAHRWKDEHSLDGLRKRIKSSCDRLRAHLGLPA